MSATNWISYRWGGWYAYSNTTRGIWGHNQNQTHSLVLSWRKWIAVSLWGDGGRSLLIWGWMLGNWPLQSENTILFQKWLLRHKVTAQLCCMCVSAHARVCVWRSRLDRIRRSEVRSALLHTECRGPFKTRFPQIWSGLLRIHMRR